MRDDLTTLLFLKKEYLVHHLVLVSAFPRTTILPTHWQLIEENEANHYLDFSYSLLPSLLRDS